MTRTRRQGGNGFGWALGVLAALTLTLATPQHVLDFDEAAGPVAEAPVEVQAHGHARTVMDHGQPGHSCAAHCAAHVMGNAPAFVVLKAPPPRRLRAWLLAADQDRGASPAFQLERPPKA